MVRGWRVSREGSGSMWHDLSLWKLGVRRISLFIFLVCIIISFVFCCSPFSFFLLFAFFSSLLRETADKP